MATSDGPPLSLRPQPVADRKPKNIGEFIARINAQPGGFRGLSEASIREQIKARNEDDGEAADEDTDMSDGPNDDDADAPKELEAVKGEVLRSIDIASQTALLTLDFLSHLISKQNPTQASATMTQLLRELAGIGTMGADRLDDSNVTPLKVREQEDVAMGWTLMEANKTTDAAQEASSFLQDEMAAEGRYWDEMMAVQKSGWSISKVPRERHTLGVWFGFSEASPEFRNNGLAPMRRGEDGSVQLDCGRLGGVSERLVVTCHQDGRVVGRSSLPAQTDDDAPLEARVLEARNTIFSQELWHELTREARTLTAYGVKPAGSQLICSIDGGSKLTVELATLDSKPSLNEDLLSNNMAETLSLALHILLSYAHRHNELMKTRPMPSQFPRSRGQQTTYALLRPIIARLMLNRNIRACVEYVGGLVKTLQRAGMPASFALRTPQSSVVDSDPATRGPNQLAASQTLIRKLLQPIDFTIKMSLPNDVSFTIRGRTFLFPVTATYYHVILPPSSPLADACCAPYKDGYPDLQALADYLRIVTARILTDHFLSKLGKSSPRVEWVRSVTGTSLRDLGHEDFELRFDVEDTAEKPTLVAVNTRLVDGKPNTKRWEWLGDDGAAETMTLDDVVDQVAASQTPS
ncbi:hypothetical protein G7046_g4335 [Stylonectria norvegica]|nr:hypothetical protein G7046_g4335 [Stylonectria norvegica]